MVVAQTVPKPFAVAPVVELQQLTAQPFQPVAVVAALPAVVLLVAAAGREAVLPVVSRSQKCWELTLGQLLDQCFAEVQQSLDSSQ